MRTVKNVYHKYWETVRRYGPGRIKRPVASRSPAKSRRLNLKRSHKPFKPMSEQAPPHGEAVNLAYLDAEQFGWERRVEGLRQLGEAADTVIEAALVQLPDSSHDGLSASTNPRFFGAFFNRDTSIVARCLAKPPEWRDRMVGCLLPLAARQAVAPDPNNDALPGLPPHEYRYDLAGLLQEAQDAGDETRVRLVQGAMHIFSTLPDNWKNASRTEITYYGELDGPGRQIEALLALAEQGVDLANVTFSHLPTGTTRSLEDALAASAGAILDLAGSKPSGLVERDQPATADSIEYPYLKDGSNSYAQETPDGTEHSRPVGETNISLEANILSHSALVGYADYLRARGNYVRADALNQAADLLAENIYQHFLVAPAQELDWDVPYIPAMLERIPGREQPLPLNTLMSDAMELLDRPFFQGPEMRAWREAVTRLSASPNFLSDTGIAPRAWRHNGMFDIVAYQDEHTRWPVMIHQIALAQFNLGNRRLAAEYWTRMLAGLVATGSFRELIISDNTGKIYLPGERGTQTEPTCILRAEEDGEENQTWTAAAVRQAVALLLDPNIDFEINPSDNSSLEDEILGQIPQYRHNMDALIGKLREQIVYYRREEPAKDARGRKLAHHDSYTKPYLRPASSSAGRMVLSLIA